MPSSLVDRFGAPLLFVGLMVAWFRWRDWRDEKDRRDRLPETWKPEPRCQR
jgi:hypothetical protein